MPDQFHIEAADVDHPNAATIRVFNLAPDTMGKVIGEFQQYHCRPVIKEPNRSV